MRRTPVLAFLLCGLLGLAVTTTGSEPSPPGVFVLGIDGVDPIVLQRLMDEERMPHFARLAE